MSLATLATRRPIRRRRTDYEYAQEAQGSAGGSSGDLTIKEGANVSVVRPVFDATETSAARDFGSRPVRGVI